VDSCPNCGAALVASEEKCPTCGDHVGPPNVRAANAPKERLALEQRYQAALERAELRNASKAVASFRAAIESSTAVANCGLYLLRELLFGGYAEHIRFAAFSLDGVGLKSYGKDGMSYGLGLRDVAIAKRASLLEENEYDFVKRHSLGASSDLPAGYRSPWEKRHELAVAKLADLIWPEVSPAEYAGILLNSTGDRSTDQFVEVHIFGTFNMNAIASVSGTSKPKRAEDRAVVTMVRELLEKQGKKWIETR